MSSPIHRFLHNHQQDVFRPHSQFRLIQENSRIFLENRQTNARVETDDMGKAILASLPASLDQLVEIFKTGDLYISPKMLYYYLLLFLESGIVEQSNQKEVEVKVEGEPVPGGKVSVVIVTFNGERFIAKNLESLYKQTLVPSEIIVVDNASGDQTTELVEKDFKAVKIIKNKRNYHYARAVNIGVEAAVQDLVIILNQDIELKEDFIEMLYHRYDAEEDKETTAGIVPRMCFNKLRTFINGIGNFVTEKGWGTDNYFGVVDIGQFESLLYVSSACFGAIMVTKAGWRKVGPLDNKYKSFYEDVDWSIRAHLKGMNLLAAPKAVVFHEFGGSYPSGLKLTFVAKNRMRFVLKNLKGKLMKKFFKQYLKQDIKNTLWYLRNKTYKNIFYYQKAYFRLLVEFPGILLQKRKNKADMETIREFFTKGSPYVVLSNAGLNPVIDKHVIRGYYYFTEVENFQYPKEPIIA
ncbi:MAG: glycosyltransferase family 2 protein [Candidatus Aminicenantes bacterium]|jgi:GT2 family glycosyltransferase